MAKYDRDRIIAESSGLAVASALGVPMKRSGSHYFVPCPVHLKNLGKEDKKLGNCWITKHGCRCAACDENVSVIEWTMQVRACSFVEALEFVADVNGGRQNYIIEDDRSRAKTKESTVGDKKTGSSPSPKSILPKPLTWEEQKVLGLTPGFGGDFYPVAKFSRDPEELKKDKPLIAHYEKIVTRTLALSEFDDRDKKVWEDLDETSKKALADRQKEKFKALYEAECDVKKSYLTLSSKQQAHLKREILADNLKEYVHEISEALYGNDCQKRGLFSHNGEFINEWLQTDSKTQDSLSILYNEHPEEYRRLVLSQANIYLQKYQNMADMTQNASDETNASLYYILVDWIKIVKGVMERYTPDDGEDNKRTKEGKDYGRDEEKG